MEPQNQRTRIVIQTEEDFPHVIYLRGEGHPLLSWDRGLELRLENENEWILETEGQFPKGEFKILIDDQIYEMGESHPLYPGISIRVNPKFPPS